MNAPTSVALGLAVALIGGAVAARQGPPASPPATVASSGNDATPSVRLSGTLPPGLWQHVRAAAPEAPEYLVIVLAADDVRTCEDLGRQLREVLRTRVARRQPVVVVRTDDDAHTVDTWLRRERIRGTVQASPPRGTLTPNFLPAPGPAVLRVSADGRVLDGVLHPTRVLNVRVVSFVRELNLHGAVPHPVPAHPHTGQETP